MGHNKQFPYFLAFDLLNIAACIAVVALHVNGGFWGFTTDPWWKFSLLIETAFYWAVPVFFMLTGATLIDYRLRYDTKTFVKKRFVKTVIPFLFWSAISIPWAMYVSHFLDIHTLSTWKDFVNAILNQQGMSIYWFFPPLFAIYLAIPVISAVPDTQRKQLYGWMIIYSFVTYSLPPVLATKTGIHINPAFQNPLNGGGYLMFSLIGYWIMKYPINRTSRIYIYILGVIGWSIRYFFTLNQSYQSGYIDTTFSGYTNFPSVCLATAVFTWFWYHDWASISHPKLIAGIKKLSSASFGVYLVHFFILRHIVDTFHIPMQSYSWSILGTPVVYILSLTLVLYLKNLPLIRKIIP